MKNITSMPGVPSNALDAFHLLREGSRAEVLNNVLYMPPSPLYKHQQLSMKLSNQIGPC